MIDAAPVHRESPWRKLASSINKRTLTITYSSVSPQKAGGIAVFGNDPNSHRLDLAKNTVKHQFCKVQYIYEGRNKRLRATKAKLRNAKL